MRHDSSAHAAEHARAEVVVRMVVREDDPLYRSGRYRPNRGSQPLRVGWTGFGIDYYNAGISNDKRCVGLPFRAPAGVPNSRIDAGSESPDRRRWPIRAESPERGNSENEDWTCGEKGTQHR
jgi:hypothetical protein